MLSINPFALPYIAYKNKANLPNSSGIYYVLNRHKREIVYIGRAKNIRNRWKSHHRDWDVGLLECIHNDGRITIAWEIYPENYLKELETKRIQEFKPIVNWKGIEDSDRYLYQGDEWQNSPGYYRYIMSNLSKEATATISERELNYWRKKPRLLEAIDYQHSITRQTIYRYKYLENYCLFYYPVNADTHSAFADNTNEMYEIINDDLRVVMQYAAPSWAFNCPHLSEEDAIIPLSLILGHLIDAGIKATNEVLPIQDYRTCFLKEIYQPSTKTCFLWMLRPFAQRLATRKWEDICTSTLADLDEGFLPIPEDHHA